MLHVAGRLTDGVCVLAGLYLRSSGERPYVMCRCVGHHVARANVHSIVHPAFNASRWSHRRGIEGHDCVGLIRSYD
jgi:hypothetical protein